MTTHASRSRIVLLSLGLLLTALPVLPTESAPGSSGDRAPTPEPSLPAAATPSLRGRTGTEPGTVTLPFAEALRLYRADTAAPREVPPPVAATLDRAVLSARLLDDAVDAQLHLEVTVLP